MLLVWPHWLLDPRALIALKFSYPGTQSCCEFPTYNVPRNRLQDGTATYERKSYGSCAKMQGSMRSLFLRRASGNIFNDFHDCSTCQCIWLWPASKFSLPYSFYSSSSSSATLATGTIKCGLTRKWVYSRNSKCISLPVWVTSVTQTPNFAPAEINP